MLKAEIFRGSSDIATKPMESDTTEFNGKEAFNKLEKSLRNSQTPTSEVKTSVDMTLKHDVSLQTFLSNNFAKKYQNETNLNELIKQIPSCFQAGLPQTLNPFNGVFFPNTSPNPFIFTPGSMDLGKKFLELSRCSNSTLSAKECSTSSSEHSFDARHRTDSLSRTKFSNLGKTHNTAPIYDHKPKKFKYGDLANQAFSTTSLEKGTTSKPTSSNANMFKPCWIIAVKVARDMFNQLVVYD